MSQRDVLSIRCEFRTFPSIIRQRRKMMKVYDLWENDSHWLRSAEMIALRYVEEHPKEFDRRRRYNI